MIASPVMIVDNGWIGGENIVNSGIVIGVNMMIGDGIVETHSLLTVVLAAGVSAKVIREI